MTNHSIDTTPRKAPRQERSKHTVGAIIEATAQVLIHHGYEGMTTARVAKRAGVSIGSVYQYFPNKEALVARLIEEHAQQMLVTMRVAIAGTTHRTLTAGLKELIRAVASAHLSNPKLHKVLSEQVPHVSAQGLALETHRIITGYIEELLRQHPHEMASCIDIALASVVIETTLEALIHKAVIDRTELLAGDVFEQQAFCLVSRYLGAEKIATCVENQ